MFRSGTSLVSRLLNISGVYLGEEDDLKAADDSNLKGFWEHRRFIRLNTAIAAQFGSGYWEFPPLFPPDWPAHPVLASVYRDARELVGRFAGCEQWGWKDPWTSLTLPFWRRVLRDEGMADELRVVVCLRNPLDVAASAAANGPTPVRRSVAAWHHYTEQALLESVTDERVLVHYEQAMQDPIAALAPALTLIGLPAPEPDDKSARAMRAYVDRGLRHHGHSIHDVASSADVPGYSHAFYQSLLAGDSAASAFLARPDRLDEELARRAFLRDEQILWLDRQSEISNLQTQVKILQNLLDTPQHRLVESANTGLRKLSPLHKLVKRALAKSVSQPQT
jgi:hypothetical protein